jgi:hypothetical protein
MSEKYKSFTVHILLDFGKVETKVILARTRYEAIQLVMYRDSYWEKQSDISKYSSKKNITVQAQLN